MPDTVLYVYIQYLIYCHNNTIESGLIILTCLEMITKATWTVSGRTKNQVQAVYLPTSERGHDFWEPNLPDLPHLKIFRILDQTRLVVLNGEQFCHPENI